MFRNMNLQARLIGAFLMMGLIVFVVACVGYNSTARLSEHIDTIGRNNLPSIEGMWKINEGQTQIQSSDRSLLNPKLTNLAERQAELTRMDKAWEQIDDGFKQYETTPRTSEEDKLYKQMLQDWDKWKQAHQEFLRLNQEFERLGILNPFERQIQLISQGKSNSPEMAAAKTASDLFNKLNTQVKALHVPFETATQSILKLANSNREQANNALKIADWDISQNKFWVFVGMTIGPLTAIVLGIVLSRAIAKPIETAINIIVISSTEIAAVVEQQERIATQQAASVNETTTVMDELGSSSRQSSQQAESAAEDARWVLQQAEEGATGARQVLTLATAGNKVVGQTLAVMSDLQEKVGVSAQQIMRLSEQTSQIGNITTVVTALANQTNMLALNASVEAVRAGESGKGFGIVAAEIRRLADQSKKSADKINNLIVDIQNAINSTVMSTDEGIKTVGEAIKFSNQTSEAFSGVTQSISDTILKNQENSLTAINDITLKNKQIALTAKQQAIAIEQVVEAMNNINSGAKQTAIGIGQTKVGTQQLTEAALNLKALGVGR